MKKILLLLGMFFYSTTVANRDAVSVFRFSTTIKGDYNAYVTTVNTACSNKEKTYLGNIFPVLNLNGSNGVSCYKISGDDARCDYIGSRYSSPPSTVVQNFFVNGTQKQILNQLGVPEKIVSKISGNYSQNISAEMALIVDSNNYVRQDRDTNFNFSNLGKPIPLYKNRSKIYYSDKSECAEKSATPVDNTVNIVSPTVETVCTSSVCLTDGKVSPDIDYIEIEGCSYDDGVYYCMSDNNSLTFNIKLKKIGTYGKMDNLVLNVNNWENTSQISSTSHFNQIVSITNISENKIKLEGNSGFNFSKKGDYTFEFYGFGSKSDAVSRSNLLLLKVKIIPNNSYKFLNGFIPNNLSVFADNTSVITYCGVVTDSNGNNLNLSKPIQSHLISGLKSNRVFNTGDEAITMRGYNFDPSTSKVCLSLSSAAPGLVSPVVNIKLQQHNQYFAQVSSYFDFGNVILPQVDYQKPYIGELKASDDGGVTWNAKPTIGTSIKYEIGLIKKVSMGDSDLLFSDYSKSIKGTSSDLVTQGLTGLNLTHPSRFELRLNTTSNSSVLPGVTISDANKMSDLVINYNLGGKKVSYFLTKATGGNDTSPLDLYGASNSFLGLKVLGTFQATGKQKLTGQGDNFTDVSLFESRTQIRKSAYTFIASMKSGMVVNGVKYVTGDYDITSAPTGYETLVVKDGNVKIKTDITNSKFGIIVLKDSYDIHNGLGAGNIIVSPNVKTINGLFYADGAFVSGDSNGNIYTTDSVSRTNALKNQLVLNGSIFTRNTIGGAILGTSGKYILPGGALTTDFDKAMMFDLNYIRRDDVGATGNINYGFVLKSNSALNTNPPKLFTVK